MPTISSPPDPHPVPTDLQTSSSTSLAEALQRARTRAERDSASTPWWIEAVEQSLNPATTCFHAPPGDLLFAPIAAPLLQRYIERVAHALADDPLAKAHATALVASLSRTLWVQVNDMLTRCGVTELHLAREAGDLQGATSAERFDSFAARFDTQPWRRRFFEVYPVMARQIITAAHLWSETITLLLRRLHSDLPDLAGLIGVEDTALTDLVGIDLGFGDRHRGGQSVSRVEFAGGVRVVYKPRPGDLDAAFAHTVRWINEQGLRHELETVPTMLRKDYCWQREIQFRRCATTDNASGELYYRQGALLALLYLLSGNDIHSENIVCAGDMPLLVDLESLGQPTLAFYDIRLTPAEQAVIDLTTDSVLRVGLLPSSNPLTPGGEAADISGMGGRAGQQTPFKFPFVVDTGLDTMRVELRHGETEEEANQPVEGFIPDLLVSNSHHLLAGFADVYRQLQTHRSHLLEDPASPLRAYRGANVRVLARHTAYYGILHMSSFHPTLVQDATAREAHYDFLYRESENVPALASFVNAERIDLWNNDIPVFTAQIDGSLIESSAAPISGLIPKTGWDRIIERLNVMSDQDRAQQEWLIDQSIRLAQINAAGSLTYPTYVADQAHDLPAPPLPATLLADAADIGHRLRTLAFPAADEVQWMGVTSSRGAGWQLSALGPDMYHGLSGIALFFAALASATDSADFADTAQRALKAAERQVDRGMLDSTNGISGLAGYTWATAWAHHLLGDRLDPSRWPTLHEKLAAALVQDTDYDVSGGAAGTLLCLANLPPSCSGLAVESLIEQAAHHLHQAQDAATGGWLPQSMQASGILTAPLAGMAHGAGGISCALQLASTLCNDPHFAASAARGRRYEDQLYNPARGNWADLRDPTITGLTDPDDPGVIAWCHGAAGIALARAIAPDGTTSTALTLERAVATTLANATGNNHSLCHGDLGNLDIIRTVAAHHARPDWTATTEGSLGISHAAHHDLGWACGMPTGVDTPGLLTGMAGIGYALLRSTDPTGLPSPLALAPDPSSETRSHDEDLVSWPRR